MLKKFLTEVEDGLTPNTWWRHEEFGSNKEASIELKELFGGEAYFQTPKPVKLLSKICELGTNSDDIILDFFAGSGTTAQAIIELNKQNGGNRKFILVQLPEPTGRDDYPTIADITKERVRRGEAMPGVFAVSRASSMRQVIDDILLLALCSRPGEWEGQVVRLPI